MLTNGKRSAITLSGISRKKLEVKRVASGVHKMTSAEVAAQSKMAFKNIKSRLNKLFT